MTSGSPLVLNLPWDVRVMKPQFALHCLKETRDLARLELDISTCSGRSSNCIVQWTYITHVGGVDSDLQTLQKINFPSLKIKALAINHHFNDTSAASVINVWGCTKKILMSLTKDTGLTSLVIRNPFPADMLRNQADSDNLVISLRRSLTSLDMYLVDHVPVPTVVFSVHCRHSKEWLGVEDELPRIYQFFPALWNSDMLKVTK